MDRDRQKVTPHFLSNEILLKAEQVELSHTLGYLGHETIWRNEVQIPQIISWNKGKIIKNL